MNGGEFTCVTLKEYEEGEVKVRLVEYKGTKYIDMRKFYKTFPTKKGIRINYELFQKLIGEINK